MCETDAPARFDRLARHAVGLLDAKAAVLFVREPDGVRVIAAHGLDRETERAIPGEQVFDEVVLVRDLHTNTGRVARAWARVDASAGACAIAPVRDVNGKGVGALVVLAAHGRAWSTKEVGFLEELAALGGEVLAASGLIPDRCASQPQGRMLMAPARPLAGEVPADTTQSPPSGCRHALARSLVDGLVVLFDHELRITFAGGTSIERAEYGAVEDKLLGEVLPPEIAAPLVLDASAALAGAPAEREMRGDNRVWRTHTYPLRSKTGQISGGMVIVENAARCAHAERALRESEARYQLLFEDTSEAMIVYRVEGEPKGAILAANPAAAALGGYRLDELHRMTLIELTAPEARAEIPARLAMLLAQGWNEGETVLLKHDGTRLPVEFRTSLVHLGGERVALSVGHDVTVRRQMEEALRAAKEAAEAANRAKSAFLANMSHEIRTPLNAILGYAQLLRRASELTRAHREGVEVINRSGEHLLALINDVLDLSKIEAGHLQINREEVDLWALLDDLAAMFRLRAQAKRLTFDVLRSTEVPQRIFTDETKLRQLLVNLLGNAIKFTMSGGIVARFVMRTTESGARMLVVEIQDTGPGIAPDDLKLLFRPFGQTRAGIHASGGTGLGLVLSREFARRMGGDVTVESRVNVGSTFRLELPVEPVRDSLATPPRPSCKVIGMAREAEPIRVLIVDGDEDNRGWVVALLSAVGFEVREAVDVDAMLAVSEAFRPRLVLLDMNMPLLDGCAVIRRLRACAAGGDAMIIALTASMLEDEREAIRAAGADGWLLKPCREDVLFAEMRRLLGVEYRYAAESARESSRSLTPLELRAVHHGLGCTLPSELVKALREAARTADYCRLLELLAEIPDDFAAIAGDLRDLAECFAYDAIDAALAQ